MDINNNEIEVLEKKIEKLKIEYAEKYKERYKKFHIRNLKVFKNICLLSLPFVISTSIMSFVSYECSLGIPFYVDNIYKYKVYSLDRDKNNICIEEDYRSIFDDLSKNSLIVYSPWKRENDGYIRFKREYDVNNVTADLVDAIMNADYDYIENLDDYKEEKQVINRIELSNNDYQIDAQLHIMDKNDYLQVPESDGENFLVTLVISLLGSTVQLIFYKSHGEKIIKKIQQLNEDYQNFKGDLVYLNEMIDKNANKIKCLTNKEGKKNES